MLLGPSANGNVAFVEMRRLWRGCCRITSPRISSEGLAVHIHGIEEIDACFQADFDEARRLIKVGGAPGTEELGSSAEGAMPNRERNLQTALSNCRNSMLNEWMRGVCFGCNGIVRSFL